MTINEEKIASILNNNLRQNNEYLRLTKQQLLEIAELMTDTDVIEIAGWDWYTDLNEEPVISIGQ